MKTAKILTTLLIIVTTCSCRENIQEIFEQKSEPTKASLSIVENQNDIATFEENYVNTYLSDYNDKVKLLGYQTMPLEGEMKVKFKELYETYAEKWKTSRGIYISPDTSFYRIYYPMHTAIVNLNGTEYTADENGTIEVPTQVQSRAANSNLSIVARVKSDKVTGCDANIITDTRIVMRNALTPTRFTENTNTFVFDMGHLCCGTRDANAPERATPCTQNHGSYPNCSDAFGIWGDNCVTRRDVCMDFNGDGTDCTKRTEETNPYFLGSDCQVAMIRGHCWNEIMF